jgi:hypothetical protein
VQTKAIEHNEQHEALIRLLVEQNLEGEAQQQAERNLLACDQCLVEFNAYRRLWRRMTDRENFDRWGAYLQAHHPEKYVLYERARGQLFADPTAGAAARGWLSLSLWRRLAFALAALLLLIVPLGWYKLATLQQAVQREQASAQKLLAETEALKRNPRDPAAAQSVEALRQQVRELAGQEQKQTEKIAALEQELAKYGKPRANAVLLMTFYGTRTPGDVQTIEWPERKLFLSGYLPEVEESEYATYGWAIADRAGKRVWQEERIRKDEEGQVRLLIGREFLPDGEYTLTIYGLRGAKKQQVSQHRFRIRSVP